MIGRMGSHEPLQAIDIWSVGCIYVETSVVKAFKSQLRSYFKVPTEAELLGMLEGTRTQARSDVQITVGISVFHCSLEVTPSHPIPDLRILEGVIFSRCLFVIVCHARIGGHCSQGPLAFPYRQTTSTSCLVALLSDSLAQFLVVIDSFNFSKRLMD